MIKQRRSSLELYQKIGPFLWTGDGNKSAGWPGDRYKTEWSATQPKFSRHGGIGANGEIVAAPMPDQRGFRNLTYIEFCEEYKLDPLDDLK